MKKLVLTAALGAACLGLAACGDSDTNTAAADNGAATGEAAGTEAADGNEAAGTRTASAAFPRGARIIEENGVTYRVDANGTRVRLGPTESRIVVEDRVRYRVDPDGTRVRIDDDGLEIDLPDVDVGINEKGNPDVDVGDRDPDGGR